MVIKKKQVYFFLGSIFLIYFILFDECEHTTFSNKIFIINILKSILLSFIISLILHFYQGKRD